MQDLTAALGNEIPVAFLLQFAAIVVMLPAKPDQVPISLFRLAIDTRLSLLYLALLQPKTFLNLLAPESLAL